jgi:hypothetical protein
MYKRLLIATKNHCNYKKYEVAEINLLLKIPLWHNLNSELWIMELNTSLSPTLRMMHVLMHLSDI